MRTFLVFLAFLILSVPSFAQKGGGTTDGGVGDGLEVTVSVDKRVKGLHYNASLPGHQATFTVTCVASGAPTGYSYHYGWSGTGVTFDDPYAASTTARVNGVMKTSVGCSVAAYPGTNTSVQIMGGDGKTIAAIGGPPLTLAPKPVQGNPETFANDRGDDTKPIYLQYFDYSHASPPTYAEVQKTQDGTATVAFTQLTGPNANNGTKMTWSYGTLRSPEVIADTTGKLTSITLQAESALTSPVTIKCSFHYVDPIDSTLTGDAEDDTAETPHPTVSSATMVNKMSVHRPKTSTISGAQTFQNFDSSLPNYIQTSAPNGNTYYAGTNYIMLLKDHLGDNMPGIWIQERFPSVPPGTTVNTNSVFWTTQMPTTNISPFIWNEYPSGRYGIDQISREWTTVIPDATADHTYWAATKFIDLVHIPLGVATGTFTITWTCSTYSYQVPKP